MRNVSCILFGIQHSSKREVAGKKVLEVGSRDENGSLRKLIELWKPAEYVGVDMQYGRGVGVLCPAEEVVSRFGKETFDIVISTEVIEHVRDWRKVISNIKNVCERNGIILLSTRSKGFPYHGSPNDFWRCEIEDMKQIFSDCEIPALEKDPYDCRVLLKVRKQRNFIEVETSTYALYNGR